MNAAPKAYIIPAQMVAALVGYLEQKPHREVNEIIFALARLQPADLPEDNKPAGAETP